MVTFDPLGPFLVECNILPPWAVPQNKKPSNSYVVGFVHFTFPSSHGLTEILFEITRCPPLTVDHCLMIRISGRGWWRVDESHWVTCQAPDLPFPAGGLELVLLPLAFCWCF